MPATHRCRVAPLLLGIALAIPAGAGAQMPLRDALALAEHAAYPNRIAGGELDAQRGRALAPLRGVLPTVRLEAGYLRTSDPIGTFSSTLRQRAITAEDFDPSRLNHPRAIGNYQAGLVLEQPVFNADAWAGRRAATHAVSATRASMEWTRLSTRADVVRAYYGAVLATERVATMEAAARAAHAHLSQAESLVRNGLATKSDALLAAVRAGEIDAQLIEARGAAASARRELLVVLGQDPAMPLTLPATLPASARIRAVTTPDTSDAPEGTRADVDGARSAREAARADALRARVSYLPRLNLFARYDWNSADRLYAGDKSWTWGVMATWSPFAGMSELADLRGAAGRANSASAQADAAAARAALESERTRTSLEVALARLDIAERGALQGAEAHRIVARKYEGGLATVAELLDAQATEIQSALALSHARFATIAAAAERRLAIGGDPGTLVALDQTGDLAADAGAH
jgi:outer membrane protein TolC